LKTIGALKCAGMGISSSIDKDNSQCFLGFYQGSGFCKFRDRAKGFDGGSTDRNVLMGGELKDLCCANCWKEMLPNTQSIEGL